MIIGDRYFIDIPDSGLQEVSKEYYEEYNRIVLKLFKDAMPKLQEGIIGKPILIGTTSPLGDNEGLETVFFQPNKYKFK